ncbi:hypothetical protein HKX48_001490 [Thoreauomyces humboldtii]|nr:hypothetical protein HKX48_001490 [Thoreauomyces humboldtii]
MRFAFAALVSFAAGVVCAQELSLPTNTIWQNVVAYDQTADNGNNTYHISTVNSYASDIQEILSGPGPFTFFAPSDHSFGRLADTNASFLASWKKDAALIKATLEYHIITGVYDIHAAAPSPHTLLPSILTPSVIDATIVPSTAANPVGWVVCILKGELPVSASIVHTMPSSNGILYVIDTMLTPPAEALAAAANGTINTIVPVVASSTVAVAVSTSVSVATATASPTAVAQQTSGTAAAASRTASSAPTQSVAAQGSTAVNSGASSVVATRSILGAAVACVAFFAFAL